MLLVVYKLYQRIRVAWILEIVVLSASVVLHSIRSHSLTIPVLIIHFFILIVLIASYKDFDRRSNPLTFKSALLFVGVSFGLVFLNATIGLILLREHIRNIDTLTDAIENSSKMLFMMDTSSL